MGGDGNRELLVRQSYECSADQSIEGYSLGRKNGRSHDPRHHQAGYEGIGFDYEAHTLTAPKSMNMTSSRNGHNRKERLVARKTIRVSDQSGEEIPEGKGVTVRITLADARKGGRELDLTDAEAERLGGRPVAGRGRRPKAPRPSNSPRALTSASRVRYSDNALL
jgi:hypothetical protein